MDHDALALFFKEMWLLSSEIGELSTVRILEAAEKCGLVGRRPATEKDIEGTFPRGEYETGDPLWFLTENGNAAVAAARKPLP